MLRDKLFTYQKAPCTATWQQLLQSALIPRSYGAMDFIFGLIPSNTVFFFN